MARAWRIEYGGALYHVLSRGNDRRNIVADDRDRNLFLDTAGEMSQRFEVDICAFVLMDNHYHLLMRTRRANLSKSMQWLGATYTKRFNSRHFRSGHLFQGRFKNMLVQNDAYLLELSYYIHRNPVRAGMVKRLSSYKWSSYRAYAYDKQKIQWLNTDLLLSQFLNVADRHLAYREAAQKYAKEEQRIWEDLRHGIFLGTKEFVQKIKKRYLPDIRDDEIPEQRQLSKSIDADALLIQAAEILSCKLEKFRKAARVSPSDILDRDMLIYLMWQWGHLTNVQIAEKFGLTYSAVSRRVSVFKNLLLKDKTLQQRFNRVKSLI
ncbi:MAG: transposase, partial [Desulfobacterales bacterium]